MNDAQLICLLKSEIQDLQDQLAGASAAPFTGVGWRGNGRIGTVHPHRGGFRIKLCTAGVTIQSNPFPTQELAQEYLDAIVEELDIPAYRERMMSSHADMRRRMLAMRERVKGREMVAV